MRVYFANSITVLIAKSSTLSPPQILCMLMQQILLREQNTRVPVKNLVF